MAGRSAAKYAAGKLQHTGKSIPVTAKGGVRYTVPKTVNPENMDDTLTVRFRVGAVYKNAYINVYYDDRRVSHVKRQIMAPGEMEKAVLKKADLQGQDVQSITVEVAEE